MIFKSGKHKSLLLVVDRYSQTNVMKPRNTNNPSSFNESTTTLNQGALKLNAACEYLGGISASSVRRLIKRDLLRPNRALRHILIPVSELDRFLQGGQQ